MLQGTGITLPAATGQPAPAGTVATQPPAAAPATAATTPAAPATGTAGNYVVPEAPRPGAAPAATTTGQPPATPPAATEASQTPAAPAAPAAAAAPAVPAPSPTAELSIAFDPASPDIPASAHGALDQLADKLAADQTLRIVVNSYATASTESNDDERESKARRMSLIRAINLRQYLFSKGVKATRLDIRALGSKGANIDRIDIVQAAPIQ
jgi:outer membrane protein OmpA-like peptidoglycan-associated protein